MVGDVIVVRIEDRLKGVAVLSEVAGEEEVSVQRHFVFDRYSLSCKEVHDAQNCGLGAVVVEGSEAEQGLAHIDFEELERHSMVWARYEFLVRQPVILYASLSRDPPARGA